MKESRKEGRFTGIDMPERTMEVYFVSDGEKIRRYKPGTDSDGLKESAALISKEDTVGPGVCGFPDHITRFSGAGDRSRAYALNPGKLRMIWDSTGLYPVW